MQEEYAKNHELTLRSSSARQTQDLGVCLAQVLRPSDVIVLTGDLGAGKTQLTKGVAKGLGIRDEITSPTFALEAVYESGRIPLYHFDLYRLSDPDELGDAGLWDVLGSDGVCLIEWGEQFSNEIGEERVDITMVRAASNDHEPSDENADEPDRIISFASHESRGAHLVQALTTELEKSLKGFA